MDSAFYNKPVVREDLVSSKNTSEDSCSAEIAHGCTRVDPATETKLVRKCDLHVVPVIALLYMLAFIDRINIGNARIQGLEKDLHMKGNDYNIALLVFFIPYILFEIPSNLIIRKIAPSTWLSGIIFCWGKSRPSRTMDSTET